MQKEGIIIRVMGTFKHSQVVYLGTSALDSGGQNCTNGVYGWITSFAFEKNVFKFERNLFNL